MPGRLYPITLKYCPLTPAEQAASLERIDPAPYVRLLQHIDRTYEVSERGDLLVFLSGMAEIQVDIIGKICYLLSILTMFVMVIESLFGLLKTNRFNTYKS